MTRFTSLALTLALGGLIATTQPTLAQSASSPAPLAQTPHQMEGQGSGMAMSNPQMMGMHDKMMADMKTMDVKLDALIVTMNSAKGSAKVDAMAELLTAMVAQHKTMRDGMMQMQGQMMMQMHGAASMPMGTK